MKSQAKLKDNQTEELNKDFCAEGGTRTHTSLRRADFKSAASAIPPPRQEVSISGGGERI